MAEKYPNYCSIAGNLGGELAIKRTPDSAPELLRSSGTDLVYIPEIHVHIPSGLDVSDALKFSCARNLLIGRVVVTSEGRIHENPADLNNLCRSVRINELHLCSGLQNALTVKGGCDEISVGLLSLTGQGGNCDAEFGNYSEQSDKVSKNIVVDRVECDGGSRPLRYRVGWAKGVSFAQGKTRYQFWQSLMVKFYCALKYKAFPPL